MEPPFHRPERVAPTFALAWSQTAGAVPSGLHPLKEGALVSVGTDDEITSA